MASSGVAPNSSLDLAALPAPRRPFRRLTLAVMALTVLFACWLAYGLRGELVYALNGGSPRDVGELEQLTLHAEHRNEWVRAEGELGHRDVLRYSRPLEEDSYRLARVEGNPKVWVEVRVPRDADGDRFVPPGSFVGRLVPVSEAGLRYEALQAAVADAGKPPLPADTWLLIDGESPARTRWVFGLFLLLLGFAAFNAVGLLRLLRRVRDA